MATGTKIDVERLIELCDRIRDYVNEPRVHAALFADTERFQQVCSAMDMIGDTGQALRSYGQLCAGSSSGEDHGTAYLVAFGALQTLYVQQDAVFWLCKNLRFPTAVAHFSGPDKWIHAKGNEKLSDIRNLRHSSVGHPVNRQKGLPAHLGSYFIVQMSLSVRGFKMLFADVAGGRQWIAVPVFELVQTQVAQLESVLQSALDEITVAEQQHRDKFKEQSLETIFAGLHYPIEKMHEAIRDDARPLGLYGVEKIREQMQTFRSKLEERSEPFGADLEYRYEQINAGLSRLVDFYEGRTDDRELADILATFVGDRIEELREWAQSKDEDYEPPPEDGDLSTPNVVVNLLIPRPPDEAV